MIRENLSVAKAHLGRLVRSALAGEEVVLCRDGAPAVRLTPMRPPSGDDPCRVLQDLVVESGQGVASPLPPAEWGELG